MSIQNKRNMLISGLLVALFTFLLALAVSLGSEALIRAVRSTIVAFTLLLVIIFLGIFFDIIGTAAAAAAAELGPFNARAAKKVFGAKQAVKLIKNADIVANLCNDVIGDIAGTLSGAIGAGIVLSLINNLNFLNFTLASAMMTSFVAALTVGGKAVGKNIAIKNANSIIFRVAVIMAWFEQVTGIEIFKNRR